MTKIILILSFLWLSNCLFAKQLFLVRGLSRQSGHWGEEFKHNLQQSFQGWNIIYLDLPGTGKLSAIKSPMKVKKFITLMREMALPSLQQDEENYILGTSLGGIVVWEWIKQFQNDFKQVLLVNTPFRGICKFKERIKPGMRKKLIQVGFVSKKKIKKRESLLYDINSNIAEPKQRNKVIDEWVNLQKTEPISKGTLLKQTVAGLMYRPSFKNVNREIKYYIFASRHDQLTDKACYENLSNLLKAPISWHDWAGHGLPIDDAEWMVDKLFDWKQSL